MKLVNRCVLLGLFIFSAAPLKAATVTVLMQNNFFSPSTVTINVGDTVTWVQRGSNHDSVSYDGLWDSGLLRLNQTFSHTFNEAGSFRYYCTPHEQIGMIGTVKVQAAANTPPTVALTGPANGAAFSTTDTITFSATASDNGSVTKVEFFSDGNLIGTDMDAPYSLTATLAAGTHSITAKATDNAGASTTSAAVSITVQAVANQPPAVTLTNPLGGPFPAPVSIVLRATATDSDGTIAQVEFFNGTTSLGVDTTQPYELAQNDLPAGLYMFSAVATDNSGARATSEVRTVGVAARPHISSVTRNGDTTILNVEGTTGIPHILEGTLDLLSWTALATNTPAAGTTVFTDSANEPRKLYRVVVR
jgi:plastocyanin